nr:MAG TPA: tail sheath protein [Caudoviricetes sp.]
MATEYQIPITYVVSASVITPQAGLEPLKLSTILLLTEAAPIVEQPQPYMIARTASAVTQAYGNDAEVTSLANTIFSQQPNILANNGYVIVAPYASEEETYTEAIARIAGQIYFEGILTTKNIEVEEAIAASTAVQAMQNRILFLPASATTALTSDGVFTKVASNYNTKCLLYINDQDEEDKGIATATSRRFAAAYASRGLAVNYNGSNTTLTMNLKDLVGIPADTQISETILQQCEQLGVDCFPSIEGLAKVVSNRQGGQYFDQVANRIWFVNTLQRSVFNVLATTGTKIPQTETGIQQLTNAIRTVCNQAVTNGMIAAGTWNGSDTFGNYDDFMRNIEEFGFYIYHQPVAEQAQADREERKAPLVQIAAKEAGSVHQSSILIYLEP